MDPRFQILLDLQARTGRGGFETLGPERSRVEYRNLEPLLSVPVAPPPRTHERRIPGPAGPIPVRVYHPTLLRGEPTPSIVYFHGGGFVIGDLDTHEHLCRRLCHDVGAVVVSVDYRLAPEHPHPAAVEDCEAALRWVLEHADELGVDPERVAVSGDSAGGNLAAVVSQRLPVRFQLLFYPATDAASELPSKREFARGYGLDRSTIDWFLEQYAPGQADSPQVSPMRSDALGSSPPTAILVAAFDVLRDEGRRYAEALEDAGVRCELKTCAGTLHGFTQMTRLPSAAAAVDDAVSILRRELHA